MPLPRQQTHVAMSEITDVD